MAKFLDNTGLAYFWSKIKNYGDSHWGGGVTTGIVYNFGAVTGQEFADKKINSGASWTGYATLTLPPGAWLLSICVQFSTHNTGYRQFTISDTTSAGTLIRTVRVPTNQGAPTSHTITVPVVGGRKYYINVCQNSGTALTVYGRYTAIKLGNQFQTVT